MRRLVALTLVGALTAACAGGGGGDEDDAAPTGASSSTTEAPGWEERELIEDESSIFFDQDELQTFDLTLSEENLAFLDADPAAEEYVEGELTYAGRTIPVGIRYKGQIGSWLGCTESSAGKDFFGPNGLDNIVSFLNPSGARTCPKLSLKVKLNWADPDFELFGLRRLNLHAMNNDSTQLHDRLGYWLYNQMGVAAPRAVHARVNINGEYSGLYVLVEDVDGRFTRRHFADGTGNLYKTVWPLTAEGRPQGESAFRLALETNEDDDPSLELMTRFATEIADAADDPAAAREVIDRWMDIDALLAQLAVERTIHHDDSPSNWLCFTDTNCFLNNFYWYLDPSDEQAWLIPWDLDVSFTNIRPENRIALIAVPDDFGEITNDCQRFNIGSSIMMKRSAACDPIFSAWVQFADRYEEKLRELLEGPFSAEVLDAKLDAWVEQITEATEEAAAKDPDALQMDEWRAAVAGLRADLEYARQHCRICPEPYNVEAAATAE